MRLFWSVAVLTATLILLALWLSQEPVADDPKYTRYEANALKRELQTLDREVKLLMADYETTCARAYAYSDSNFCKYWQP